MSGSALVAVAVSWAILVAFLCVVLVKMFSVLSATHDLLEDVRRQTTPMLRELNATVENVNHQLEHVEEILTSVKGTSTSVERLTTTAATVVANPAMRGLALAAGAARAYRSFRRGR